MPLLIIYIYNVDQYGAITLMSYLMNKLQNDLLSKALICNFDALQIPFNLSGIVITRK